MNRIYLILALVVLTGIKAFSTNYYISFKGSDDNNGRSPNSSWKSLAAISDKSFNPGDSILLKCGEVFEGAVTINFSGTSQKPIVISSYSSGAAPVITGAVGFTGWIKGDMPFIKVTSEKEITGLYVDNEKQTLARFPNSGFLLMEKKLSDGVGFYDSKLNQPNKYWEGATVRYRGNWQAGNAEVTSFSDHQISVPNGSLQEFSPENGYYFDNKYEELDTCKEWFYNPVEKLLYFYPQKQTAIEKIRAVVYKNGLTFNNNVGHIIISGLKIDKYDGYGVVLFGDNKNIQISNCVISNINGTGVHLNEKALGCSISNSDLNNISGRGIFALEPENLTVSGNHIHRIGFNYGYGINGVHGMVGIAVVNHETKKDEKSNIARSNYISNNSIDSTGYVGIRCDGTNNVIENNLVYNTMLCLNDGGAIYCWATGPFYTHHNVIRNNIVFNCIGNINGTQPGTDGNMARGIYLDNNVYNIQVEGNTVVNVSHAGIYINDGSHDNQIKHNTIYNSHIGLCINVYARSNTTTNHLIENNVICGINPSQRLINFIDWTKPNTDNLALLNKNIYINLSENFLFQDDYEIENKTIKIKQVFQFKQWQDHKQQDKASQIITKGSGATNYSVASLFLNETKNEKKIQLSKNKYYSLNGEIVNSEITINPLSSQVLLIK
jgi:parallel beta-helix repeat protein